MKFFSIFLFFLLVIISQSCSHIVKNVDNDFSDDAITAMKNLREGDIVNGILADTPLSVITEMLGVTMGKGVTSNPTFTISDPSKNYKFILVFQVSGGNSLNIYDMKYILHGKESRSVFTVESIRFL